MSTLIRISLKQKATSAAREAFEEAGVVGAVAKRSVGSFSYEKRLKNGGAVVCEAARAGA
jgi:8-oxo-dGTP pyrophosphatase MutT (NUDIX family)